MARVSGLSPRIANILKQEALSLGGDAALPAAAYSLENGECGALVMGSPALLAELADKLARHGGDLADLGERLRWCSRNYQQASTSDGLPSALGGKPWQVMGVLNITPDSFYDGGRHLDTGAALAQAGRMAAAGAGIIDVGGESTRPGADAVGEKEELARVLPVVERIASELDVPVSIDTSKAKVAREALQAGAAMINDVTALTGDRKMVSVAADYGCPLCLMHMRGTPRNMQRRPRYRDVVSELIEFFHQRVEWAAARGVARGNIIIDPGIGFGKGLEHNLTLLNHLDSFLSLGRPLLVGVSRKSFIGMIAGKQAGDRLPGTIAANVFALERGARIFRVHDVAENRQALEVAAGIGFIGGDAAGDTGDKGA
ncbi:dihydropteroate synthase [bacterium BMS3Abin01]|nr:dihydropteroate synthase [bacterium BMS3Abin01]